MKRNFRNLVIALVTWAVFAGGVGCVSSSTRLFENPDRKLEGAEAMLAPIRITPETVIVDARSRFDYSVAHIPRSVSLQWSDFSEREPAQRGVLQGDLFAAARRLARAGIGPESRVVVVGQGLKGGGEEGRIAWMLAYLGVTQVQFADIESLRPRMTNVAESNSPAEVPTWKPEPIESLNVTRDELRFVIDQRGVEKPISYRGRTPTQYRIVDVRSEKDYLGREGFGAKNHVPNMDAINIPWTHFFTKDLRPNQNLASELASLGLTPAERIIVLGEDGVSSAAVTMALRALGYERAGNYSGGLVDLLSAYQ